jgi:hypothetical protein
MHPDEHQEYGALELPPNPLALICYLPTHIAGGCTEDCKIAASARRKLWKTLIITRFLLLAIIQILNTN